MLTRRDVPEIDLERLAEKYELRLEVASLETPEEREARLSIEAADARHARWRITTIYAVAVLGVLGVSVICAYVVLGSQFSAEDKAWARPILAAMIAGLLGFVIRGKVSAE